MLSLAPLVLISALVALASAAPLHPRQVVGANTTAPSLVWSGFNHNLPGNIYVSNKDYTCGPYTVEVSGVKEPYTLDVVLANDVRAVLVPLGANFTGSSFRYIPNVPVGTAFLLRLTDAEGKVAYSTQKTVQQVAEDGKWGCKDTAHGKRKKLEVMAILLGGIFGGPIALMVLLGLLVFVCQTIKRMVVACRSWREPEAQVAATEEEKEEAVAPADPATPVSLSSTLPHPQLRGEPALVRLPVAGSTIREEDEDEEGVSPPSYRAISPAQ